MPTTIKDKKEIKKRFLEEMRKVIESHMDLNDMKEPPFESPCTVGNKYIIRCGEEFYKGSCSKITRDWIELFEDEHGAYVKIFIRHINDISDE